MEHRPGWSIVETNMKIISSAVLLLVCCSNAVAETATPERCADIPVYNLLDFWVGEWAVYSGDEKVGENRIEKILSGCAVMEHWKGAGGGEGKSLFFVAANGNWKQVWVTEWATNRGGVKEKTHVGTLPGEAIRFQGQLEHPDVGTYLDRTTLTPNENGSVRQVIEISKDGGATWKTTFEAIYSRVTSGQP